MLWDARHFLEKIGAAQVPLKCIFIHFIKLFHTSLHIFEAIKHKTMSIKTLENHAHRANHLYENGLRKAETHVGICTQLSP